VPDEWLDESEHSSTKPKTGLGKDDDDLSDLTELSEDEGEQEPEENPAPKEDTPDQASPSPEPPSEPEPEIPADFIEWETVGDFSVVAEKKSEPSLRSVLPCKSGKMLQNPS
jgi:hypothetical protein